MPHNPAPSVTASGASTRLEGCCLASSAELSSPGGRAGLGRLLSSARPPSRPGSEQRTSSCSDGRQQRNKRETVFTQRPPRPLHKPRSPLQQKVKSGGKAQRVSALRGRPRGRLGLGRWEGGRERRNTPQQQSVFALHLLVLQRLRRVQPHHCTERSEVRLVVARQRVGLIHHWGALLCTISAIVDFSRTGDYNVKLCKLVGQLLEF